MRRRPDELDAASVPPLEFTDYRLWCANRGVVPFGNPADLVSMRAAVSQWQAWERLRTEWAQAHGVDEGDLGGGDDAPFDVDAI